MQPEVEAVMRVLLAEDNVLSACEITLALKAAHILVDHVDQGEEAIDMMQHYDYDVVLIGCRLSDMNGLQVLRRIRAARHLAPILMLGGHTLARTKVEAFGAGADDFLAMPMDHDELVARIQAVARRSRGFSDPTIRIGALQLNTNSQEALYGERPISLTRKEFSILELLVLRKGKVLTKDAFLNHLYNGTEEPEAKIIDVFICKLRKKLQAVGCSDLIGTVWGQGYILREGAGASPALAAFDAPVSESAPAFVM